MSLRLSGICRADGEQGRCPGRLSSGAVVGAGAIWPLLAVAVMTACGTTPPETDPADLPATALAPPAAAYEAAVEEARSIVRSQVAEERLPGLSLAVAVDGAVVWAEGFGWADLESRAPVTPATLFRIGGISETLTAAAVGLLVERGRLDLDAPVQRYVPEFPDKEWTVSTRQLMAGTAGVRRQRGEGEIFRSTGCADDTGRLASFADDPLRHQPGAAVSASPYGWVLVGAVVAAAAGEPYREFMQREILTPLAMGSTAPDGASRAASARAHLYYPSFMLDPRRGLQDAPQVDLSCLLPAAGFVSTPSDLVRFGSAMMAGSLLRPATVAALQAPVRLTSGESTGRGLGWDVLTVPMGAGGIPTRILGRGLGDPVRRSFLSATTVGGHAPGGTAALLTVPGSRLAVAVASNVSGARGVSLLSTRLSDIFVRALQER